MRLGDVVTINPESINKDYPHNEIEYIDISSVGTGIMHGSKKLNIKEAPSRAKRIVKNNDILLATVRPNLRSFWFAKNTNKNTIASTGFAILRASSSINPRFLYYTVIHQPFTDYLTANAKGAAYPAVDTDTIQRADIYLPPFPVQSKIAAILSAYDDLIENNLRRIKILEKMAQLIYREWFVHFRFPGHEKSKMVDSPLGKIPEGWEVKELIEFGKIVTGKTPSKSKPEFYGAEMPFIKLPDMRNGIYCIRTIDNLSKSGADTQKSKTIPPNSLCVSCIGTVGKVSITANYSQTNQQINSIVLNKDEHLEYLYFTLLGMKQKIESYSATGATMNNLNRGKFISLKVLCPPNNLIDIYHDYVSSLFRLTLNLQLKNEILKHTRDLLLPKLISGELDVSNLDITLPEEVSA